jgi:hypothetical protein
VRRSTSRRDAVYPQRRREVYERADGLCEARASSGCSGRCEQVHHVGGRVGPDPHRLDNLLGVCASCHETIHRFPAWSRDRGLMTSRLRKAD